MLKDGFSRFFVLPIQVRLLGTEEMKIVLLRLFIPLPHAASEVAHPIVWWFSHAINVFCRPPDIPISFWVIPGTSAFLEPLVLYKS